MKALPFSSFISAIIIVSFLGGCGGTYTSYTSTEITPAFKIEPNLIHDSISKISDCENLDLDGWRVDIDGKTNTLLEVTIHNGDNIPNDTSELKMMAKHIAQILKLSLKDTNTYEKYNVVFETKRTFGIMTKEQASTIEFNSKDL